MEWLKKLLSFFRRKPKAEPEVSEDVGQVLRRQYQEAREARPRTTIRPSDGGMRKLSRHRGGRQYEKRRGIDHTKRMDGEFHDTPRKKKKRGWAENRHN